MSSQERLVLNITDKMVFKYNCLFTNEREEGKEGAFEKVQKLEYSEVKKVHMKDLSGENLIAFSLKGENYEIALSIEKYKNGEKIPKETISFQGTDQKRDSDLMNRILEDLS